MSDIEEEPEERKLPLLLLEPHVFKNAVQRIGCKDVIRLAMCNKLATEKVGYAKVDMVAEAWVRLGWEYQITLLNNKRRLRPLVDVVWTIRKQRNDFEFHKWARELHMEEAAQALAARMRRKDNYHWTENIIINGKVLSIRNKIPNRDPNAMMPEIIGNEMLLTTQSPDQIQALKLALKFLSQSFRPPKSILLTVHLDHYPDLEEVFTFDFLKNVNSIKIEGYKKTLSSSQLKFLMDNFKDLDLLDLSKCVLENYSEDEIEIKAHKVKINCEHMTLEKLLKIDAAHIHFNNHQLDSHDINTYMHAWLKGNVTKRLKTFSVDRVIDRIDELELNRNLVRLTPTGVLSGRRQVFQPWSVDLIYSEMYEIVRDDPSRSRATISYHNPNFLFFVW